MREPECDLLFFLGRVERARVRLQNGCELGEVRSLTEWMFEFGHCVLFEDDGVPAATPRRDAARSNHLRLVKGDEG